MREEELQGTLAGLPLGGWRTYEQVTSTNDVALEWAANGAADLALVVAEEQTAGRGRFQRRWVTTPGAALAFSLVLRPSPDELSWLARMAGLGALAIHHAFEKSWQLESQIKWPNDVLLKERKVAGILVENTWLGDRLQALVIGIGVNISPRSVPPPDQLLFPATCLEAALGRPVERWAVLHDILAGLLGWRRKLASPTFMQAWDAALAFKGESVYISGAGKQDLEGKVIGLSESGSLRLAGVDGQELLVDAGDVRLRKA